MQIGMTWLLRKSLCKILASSFKICQHVAMSAHEQQQHTSDVLYKKFFSDAVVVESLLRDFITEELALQFDFSTLELAASLSEFEACLMKYDNTGSVVKG